MHYQVSMDGGGLGIGKTQLSMLVKEAVKGSSGLVTFRADKPPNPGFLSPILIYYSY